MTYYATTISGPLDQGDILAPVDLRDYFLWWQDGDKRPIVIVTPACDLAQEKTDYHRICVLKPLPLLLYAVGQQMGLKKDHWDGQALVSKGKKGDFTQKIRQAITNGLLRYHFLPSDGNVFKTDYFIDFEILTSVPLDKLSVENRIARLNPPYKQELIQRLGVHLMRIGTPDIPEAHVHSLIDTYIGQTKLKFAA